MWELSLLCLTVVILLLPLLPALWEWWAKRDVEPLHIIQTHEGNIRYFAEQFRAFITNELRALTSHGVTAEPRAQYCVIAATSAFRPSQEEYSQRITQRRLLAIGRLALPDNFTFARELYGRDTIVSGKHNRFRAVLAERDLVLGAKSVVGNWIHARRVYGAPDCLIFGRLSAEKEIVLEPGCRFTRVHAPWVQFGADASPRREAQGHTLDNQPQAMVQVPGAELDSTGRWIVDGHLDFPAYGVFSGDIVVYGNLTIRRGAAIHGSVKARGTLRLESAVTVRGALISGTDLIIGTACAVCGPLMAEQQVDIDAGVVVGTLEKLTTVTAPHIHITSGVIVHGTVWAREQGMTRKALQS